MGKSASQKMRVTEYFMSIHFGLATEIDALLEIQVDEKTVWSGTMTQEGNILINKPDLHGGIKKEGGAVGVAYFLPGGAQQMLPEALANRLGLSRAASPAFRHRATIFFVGEAVSGWTPIPGGGGGGGTWTPPGGGSGGNGIQTQLE